MNASNSKSEDGEGLSRIIRRQIGTQVNRRLIGRLPAFAPQGGPLPEQLSLLLDELDRVEVSAPGSPAAARSGPYRPASAHGRSLK